MIVDIQKLHEDAIIPKNAYEGDVGIDLHTIDEGTLLPNERALLRTGLAVKPPKGYEMQIRPRSGLAYKKGITVLNSPATIEPTYRGDVGIILYNAGQEPLEIRKGDRIAQAVFKKYEETVEFKIVDELDGTERGSNGFGSSGV
ncbi:dUTP diphosphatase [Halobacillus ihumii]|uniref:dUTP diphosphatase n=1 Tax=Halobacillus ihumii TaxID=2686092 RepID=UPI0013D0C419|nr:dUTP diphosphatase [Halobacillus ihumii]